MSILPETHTDQMYSWFPLYIPIQTPMYIVCSFLDAVVLFILRTSLACLFGERRTNPKYNECDTLQKHRCGMNGAWTLRSRRLFIIRMENTSGLDCKKWIVLLNNYMFCFVVFSWLYNCTHTHLIVLFETDSIKQHGVLLKDQLTLLDPMYFFVGKYYEDQKIMYATKIINGRPVTVYLDSNGNKYYEE